ncbi:histidinol-phosphatase [Niallia sp. 03133]|uniref:histidinol-phosphatase n=1 Tax=Niallia sp. 03133 TaxID=3458060 RepID=UPI004043C826
MLFDLHTHHDRCGHAVGKLEEYILSAIGKGLHYIGVSDHSPHFYSDIDHLRPIYAMANSEFDHYIKEVLQLKEAYKSKIHVLLGMESDYFPKHIEIYRKKYQKYPFDYLIGSVHFVYGVNIFETSQWEGLDSEQRVKRKEAYYHLIQQSAKSGIFQVIGHMDAMKGNFPAFSNIETPIIDETLKVIAEEGISIEINTSSTMKGCGDWYPSQEILERASYFEVDVTYGSDAHHPDRVGDSYLYVQKKLKEIGFKEMVYYVEKKRRVVPL